MKLKPLIISVALLGILAFVLAKLDQSESGKTPADPFADKPLITSEALENLRHIELYGTGSTPAVTLKRSAGHWRVNEQHELPANFDTLARLVQNLAEAKFVRTVTRNPERLAGLKLNERRIVLKDNNAATLLDVHIGENHSSGGIYARLGDDAAALLMNQSLWFQTTPGGWVEKQLLPGWKLEDIAAVELPFPAPMRQLSLSRPDTSTPFMMEGLPENEAIRSPEVVRFVRSLINARWTTVTPDLDQPQVVQAKENAHKLVLKHFDGSRIQFQIGREPARPLPAPESDEEEADSTEETANAAEETSNPSKEPAMSDPGPVYAFLKPEALDHPLYGTAEKLAFALPASVFETLPKSPEDLIELSADTEEQP
jgi:hypothetical protein